MAESWRLKGAYLETCNCDFLCPCILGPRNENGGAIARPTRGHCDTCMVFRVDEGALGGVDLAGTHAAFAIHTRAAMADGDWTMAHYIDAAASPEQQAALETIFTGEAGGVLANLKALTATRLPTCVVAIEFAAHGRRRRAAIPDVLDVEIEGVEGKDGDSSWLDNVRHFVSSRLAAAKTLRGSYTDHGSNWDNEGLNAHYASFEWTGP